VRGNYGRGQDPLLARRRGGRVLVRLRDSALPRDLSSLRQRHPIQYVDRRIHVS